MRATNTLSFAERAKLYAWCQENADRCRAWNRGEAAKWITAHAGLGFAVTSSNLRYLEHETATLDMGKRVSFSTAVKREAAAIAVTGDRATAELLRLVHETRDELRALRAELGESLFLKGRK